MKVILKTFCSVISFPTILLGFNGMVFASHVTNGCHKGMAYLYRGKNFEHKDKFCYVKVHTLLSQANQMFSIKDLIINCAKDKYLEHYKNLVHETIGNQIYLNNEQWVGSYDDKLIHHMQIPNSEEVKTFNLYQKQKSHGKNQIYLEFKSENLIQPKESYKIDLELADSCLF
jgi:hypothetical protein